MPLQKGSQHYPTNQRDWDQWSRDVAVTPDPDSVGTVELKDAQVTYQKIQTIDPVSVIGNLNSSAQSPGPITAATNNTFLVRRSNLLTFDNISDIDIPATIARDTEVAASISTAIAALQALPDPFPVYLNQTEGDARYVQLANVLNGSKTYDPPSLATGTQTTTTVTLTGAALGDYVQASFSLDLQGVVLSAYVSAANTVTVVMLNMTGGTLDLASGTLKVRGWKQ
jgi:hypothetical protein